MNKIIVKIIGCSLPFMWYRDYVGKEFECQVHNNKGKLFESFTGSDKSFKTNEDLLIPVVKRNKIPVGNRVVVETIKTVESFGGWILFEDAIIVKDK